MAASVWARGLAAALFGLVVGGPAAAQNYDGDMLLRFGAFGQGAFLNYGVTQPATGTASANSFIGGLSAGIDYRPSPYWLIGVEADASLGDARANFNNTSFGLDYLFTARGRFGVFPHPDWLIYGTAGWAALGIEVQRGGTGSKAVETLGGAIVGLGVEYNWHHVILFGEYDYATYGSRAFTINNIRHETDADSHLVRVGIKFKVGHDHFDGLGRHYEPLK